MTFDRALHVAASGGLVYFGPSADHKIYCLEASTGRTKWVFFTEGPVLALVVVEHPDDEEPFRPVEELAQLIYGRIQEQLR